MSTRDDILAIMKTLRTAYPFAKINDADALVESYVKKLSAVPMHILEAAVDWWTEAEDFFPHRPGQLKRECYRIAGLSPGMDFSNIPDPTQGWQTDELTKEYYELEDMFYNGRIFFPPDWYALVARLKDANRESMAERVDQKRANFEYIIANEHTPTLPGEEAWQLRKDVA